VWDVAYHADHGRDVTLLNPPHGTILAGLGLLGIAGLLTVVLATLARADAGLHIGPLRVPYSALPLGAMGAGALIGFPLDDLWHQTYGIDVTLWSPTHLQMIGGAALATFTLPLFALEAGLPYPTDLNSRVRLLVAPAGFLLALSVFQLEFDFGVPQWQAVYAPLLIAIAAGICLVAARAAIGPWAPVWAALIFLGARALLSLLTGPVLGHTVPRFPLYLGSALAVELAFRVAGRRGPVVAGLLSGALIGTLGMAVEWAWSHVWGVVPWSAGLLPRMWLPLLAAVLAALVGLALGRILARERPGLPAWAVVGSVLGMALLLALALPRTGAHIDGTVTATPVGSARMTVDRDGLPATEQDVQVDVTLAPASGANGADWFEVLAWQGGGVRPVPLTRVSPGHYRAQGVVPTGASWKAMVFLAKGSEMVAFPISFPIDPAYGSAGIPLQPVRQGAFVPARQLLTTEAHGGPPAVAVLAYTGLLGLWTLWIGLLLFSYRQVSRRYVSP
jgi:hypothetical protein